MRKNLLPIALLLVPLSLVACGSDSVPATAAKGDAFCKAATTADASGDALKALASDPEETARILQLMLRLRDAERITGAGGCLDASREYPRWVCPDTSDVLLPSIPRQADSSHPPVLLLT